LADLELDPETTTLLDRYGFDRPTFQRLRQRLIDAGGVPSKNIVTGKVEAPEPGDLTELPEEGTAAHAALVARGEGALAAGQVGIVVLAGGMATRWGGGTKAVVEALPGYTFLSLKIEDAKKLHQRLGGTIPAYFVVSFATHDAVAKALAATSSPGVPLEAVPQSISMRILRDGSLARGDDGRPSLYAPGHGDLPSALRNSGALARFRAGGGRVLLMSNVDNLAATLDPAVIGAHLAGGRPVTCEVVRAQPGDTGGAPARLDGVPQVIEGFRFPPDFPVASLPVFNTNTFVLDAEALDRDFDFTWFAVTKKVAGREVMQFERLVGELTSFLPSTFLVVPRQPPNGRFQPAKDPQELERGRPAIRAILQKRGVIGG
jgi:UTP--glucose-1-phosphate uridylyltransferase